MSDSLPNHTSTQPNFLERPLGEKVAFMVLYVILTALILVLNTLVVCAYHKNKRLRTAINMFFACLAASDLLVGAISIPLWSLTEYIDVTKIPNEFRKIYLFFDVLSALASILFLTAICVEKYLGISSPINHRLFPFHYYRAAACAIWCTSLVVAVLFIQDFGLTWSKWRGLIVFSLGFMLPLCVIIVMHIKIWKNITAFESRRRRDSYERKLRSLQRQRRAAWTIAIVIGLFVVAWLPFFICSIVFVLCGVRCMPASITTRHLVDVVKILHYSNSVANPLVYGYRNDDMRRTVKRIVVRPCTSTTPRYKSQQRSYDMKNEPIPVQDRTMAKNEPETPL